MAEVQSRNTNWTSDATDTKKRKGFWSNIFGRSSYATDAHKKKYEQEPERTSGFMNSLMNNARRAATKEVVHIAEDEAKKQVENQLNNNNGSQPQPTDTSVADMAPDASTATASDALNAPTNWVDSMVDSTKQKMQGLQSLRL